MNDLIENLVEVSSAQKEDAVELVFNAYANNLCAYATKNWKVSEDMVWDIIYKSIYKLIEVIHAKSFETEKQLKAYLFRIFINYLKNAIRDLNTKRQGLKEIELQDKHANAVTEKPIQSPELTALTEILDELEDWKRILLLLRNQGVAYSEIAKLIDKPEKNIKVYYGRLKKEVKNQLAVKLTKSKSHG